MGAEKKLFSFAEVSPHNVAEDCWIIINSKIYNVTDFMEDHPGGEEILLAVAGTDASEDFEDAGHGSAARLMLDEFYVGEIDPSTLPKTTYSNAPSKNIEDKSSDSITKFLPFFFVPIAIFVVAVGIHLYT
ncbi:unnamed protein product [Camellia sinensis]